MSPLNLNINEQHMAWPPAHSAGSRLQVPPPYVRAAHETQFRAEEPTLSVLHIIPIGIAIILFSFGLAMLIVRVQRRREARKTAFESEVPPPYEDGDWEPPAYCDKEECGANLKGGVSEKEAAADDGL